MRYAFGDCVFDAGTFELERNGVVVDTTPQALSLLQFLLQNRGRLVSKHEVIDEVWSGRSISDSALSVRLHAVRHAIGDDDQQIIKTVHGRGFRFTAIVQELAPQSISQAKELPKALAQATRPPSVAVQPFHLLVDGGEYAYLAEALPDEMITALSRLHILRVVSRGSSFRFPSFSADHQTLSTQLGADYSVGGEMEIQGQKISLSIELSDTDEGAVIWRDRLSLPLGEIHEAREDFVHKIASAVHHHIERSELQRARIQVPESLSAWHGFHFGMQRLMWNRRPDYESAQSYFSNAIEADPSYARANAGLATMYLWSFFFSWEQDLRSRLAAMERTARLAYELDPSDPFCVMTSARADMALARPGEVMEKLNRAVDLGPSDTHVRCEIGRVLAIGGHVDEAQAHVDIADALHPLDLSPRQPLLVHIYIQLVRQNGPMASEYADRLMRLPAPTIYTLFSVIAAYHLNNEYEKAAATAAEIKLRFPGMTGTRFVAVQQMFDEQLAKLFREVSATHDLH